MRGVSLPVSLSHGFVPCKASWMPRTPWPSALTNSSATCKRFVRSTETSASTARRHSESLRLWTNWLLSGLPVFVDGWIKPLLVVSHSHSENSTGACGPSMLGDSCSPDADVDAHQCRESCNFTVMLWLVFSSQLLSGCWLESVDLFVSQACSPIWWTTGSSSSRVTLRSVVPGAKCPKPVTLTLSVTQRSSGRKVWTLPGFKGSQEECLVFPQRSS